MPLLYGTVWIEPPIVFARNDGNLTRMEALVGAGRINQILKVLVNNVEIPEGIAGQDMTGSGWWNLVANGGRAGGFNPELRRSTGHAPRRPLRQHGCPIGCGSLTRSTTAAYCRGSRSWSRGCSSNRLIVVETSQGTQFSDNPAWMLLDVLRRTGWRLSEIDLASFADAAAFCDQTIAATDNNGNPVSVKRFQCNLAVRSRRTAADVIRGVRNNARLQLTYGSDGKLAVHVENSLLLQQPTKPAGSNAPNMVNGGWPAYVYADGSVPGLTSGILRRSDNSSTVRMWSRPIVDAPNRFSIEFADRYNEYQQDSLALVDVDEHFPHRTGDHRAPGSRWAADVRPSGPGS